RDHQQCKPEWADAWKYVIKSESNVVRREWMRFSMENILKRYFFRTHRSPRKNAEGLSTQPGSSANSVAFLLRSCLFANIAYTEVVNINRRDNECFCKRTHCV